MPRKVDAQVAIVEVLTVEVAEPGCRRRRRPSVDDPPLKCGAGVDRGELDGSPSTALGDPAPLLLGVELLLGDSAALGVDGAAPWARGGAELAEGSAHLHQFVTG